MNQITKLIFTIWNCVAFFIFNTLFNLKKSQQKNRNNKREDKKNCRKKVVSIYLGNVCIVENLTTITTQLVWHKLLMRTASQYSMCVCFTIYLYLSFFFPFFWKVNPHHIASYPSMEKRKLNQAICALHENFETNYSECYLLVSLSLAWNVLFI